MIAWKSRVPGQAEATVGDPVSLDWCQLSLIERGVARQLISRDSTRFTEPGRYFNDRAKSSSGHHCA
jgi:hypothetical protein